ncbi:3-oxoacyl-ACP reductase [Spongiactinospora gelatinilytica]|uniref:3-oxoacyl-ACP reductase n=1 Tax=Spongiactinospora gelatinilytica TaxID=2666298 RepID=A0A2W2FA29_9ACTN|nr:SDR family oxidoreductase [Spongiactinospora gelatinilytica]PZG32363.1 3-oxoacyl-ACP reductase [Spongiactinospora gelatinilytica]
MDLGLNGRRALVGGATSGLGLAIAHALAAEGAELLLWSRDEERLAGTAAEIAQATGVRPHIVAADATDPGAADRVAAAAGPLGGVDVLVLNAGGPPAVPPDATSPDAWRSAFQMLAVTPIELATRLLPGMRERGFGRIVAVLSSGVREPIPALAYSNAGRSALAAWLKTVSREVAADGVTVNGVLPGRIATPRVAALDEGAAAREGVPVAEVSARSQATIPAGRYGRPEEFAAVVAFLASTAASYVTGSTVACDGGMLRGLQ